MVAETSAEQRVAFPLHARQYEAMRLLFEEGVNQLLFGGAAGGGKSHWLRALAFTAAQIWPGAKIPIFRLTLPELYETHIEPWLMTMAELGYDIEKGWSESKKEYTFPNRSVVEFRHIDQKLGAKKWLSSEWAIVLIDEGGTFDPNDIRLLYSRVRRPKDSLRARNWKGWRPMMAIATNPGGPAHAFLRETFIEPSEKVQGDRKVWDATVSLPDGRSRTIKRAFLQSKLYDNPSIDPDEYEVSLMDLPEEDRARMLDGDWTYFEGQVFNLLPEIHYVDVRRAFGGALYPPHDWPRVAGYDHGNANPAAAEWLTRDEDGFVIAYQEYHSPGANATHIDALWSRMQADGVTQPSLTIVGDPQMVRKDRSAGALTFSVAEEFLRGGMGDNGFREGGKGVKLVFPHLERRPGREILQRWLERDPSRVFPGWHPLAGEFGAPRLFIGQQCPALWNEIVHIRRKPGDPDEDTIKVDDHAYDALWRAALVFERALSIPRRRGRQPMLVLGTR